MKDRDVIKVEGNLIQKIMETVKSVVDKCMLLMNSLAPVMENIAFLEILALPLKTSQLYQQIGPFHDTFPSLNLGPIIVSVIKYLYYALPLQLTESMQPLRPYEKMDTLKQVRKTDLSAISASGDF